MSAGSAALAPRPGAAEEAKAAPARRRLRLLYLYPATVGPYDDARINPHTYLSREFTGDFVATWVANDADRATYYGPISRAMGDFGFTPLPWSPDETTMSSLPNFGRMVRAGLHLARTRGPYDAILAYGPYSVGLAGVVLRRLLRTPLVVEFPGRPVPPPALHAPGALAARKRALGAHLVRYVARHADAWRMLYPGQLAAFPELAAEAAERGRVFHEFVPVHLFAEGADAPRPAPPYLLFVGHPWRLKGVDVLLDAWRRLGARRGDWQLKVVGHCPDRSPWEALRAGDPSVEFHPGASPERTREFITGCSALVLPSRTEAMGRVLLEAMATRRPVVASAVDGIPHYVRDGDTGLLVPPDDAGALAEALGRVLGDPAFAAALAARGRREVLARHDEAAYVAAMRDVVELAVARGPGRRAA